MLRYLLLFSSNVLSATGVDLNVMTLQIRIYRAHDLPQMDPEYYEYFKKKIKRLFGKEYKMKDCVDPYCTVKFAGHKRTTNVRKNNDDPVWNEQFNIAFRVSVVLMILCVCDIGIGSFLQ